MSEELNAEDVPDSEDSASFADEAPAPTLEQVLDSGYPTLEQLAELLPRYEFHDVLGVGGMGAVYLARQAALDRWVAIKLLPQAVSMNEEDAQRFIKEARSMAKLTHANIAAVYDFGQTVMGHLYLVMEHVQGLDLHRLIHRDEVTPHRIRALVPQLCDALQYAHDHGIIHRDIKPANILITHDWQIKLVDFGLAGEGMNTAADVEFGTPEYVAPERLEHGAVVDHRADIFALGVVIHEMFTKETLLSAGSSSYKGMPESFINVVMRCTANDPAKRFQRASEIKNYLAIADVAKPSMPAQPSAPQHLQAGAHIRRPQQPVDVEKQSTGEAPKWLWAAGVVLLLGGGYWLTQRQSPPSDVATLKTEETAPAVPKEPGEKPEAAAPAPTAPMAENAPKTAEEKKAVAAPESPEKAAAPKMAEKTTPMPAAPAASAEVASMPYKLEPGDFSIAQRLSGHSGMLYGGGILKDQRRIVCSDLQNTVRVWDVVTGKLLKSIAPPFGQIINISGATPSPTTSQVLIHSLNTDEAAVIDVETGAFVSSVKAPNDALNNAIWDADGTGVYVTTRHLEGGAYFWDPSRPGQLEKFNNWNRAAYEVFSLTSPTGERQLLVYGATVKDNGRKNTATGAPLLDSVTYHASLYSAKDRRLLRQFPDMSAFYSRMTISPDGTRLCGGSNAFAVFDTSDMQRLLNLPSQADNVVMSSAWLDGSRLVLMAYADGDLVIREAEKGAELARIQTGIRVSRFSVSKDQSWAAAFGFKYDATARATSTADLLILRLPDLAKLGSEEGRIAAAARQLANLSEVDPGLAAIRDSGVTAPDAITTDDQLITAVKDLTLKYGAALKRASISASPKDQVAMNAEADAVAKGAAVPDESTDAATSGEHKRFRGIYRQQFAALDAKRKQGIEALRNSIEPGVKTLAQKRRDAGDAAGAARCEALLASYDKIRPFTEVIATAFTTATPVIASAAPAAAGTPLPAAPVPSVPSPASTGSLKLNRQGKPGELIKIERTTKNGYVGNTRTRVGSVPPTLGPVWQVACNNYHGLVILADGSLKGWGSWDFQGAAYVVPPEVKDAVMIATTENESAAVLGNNSVIMWNDDGAQQKWTPPGGVEIKNLIDQENWGFYVLTADGGIHAISSLSVVTAGIPPAEAKEVVDATGSGVNSSGSFAVKKDGTILHWGQENLYLGQQHLSVKDALAIAESNHFLCVVHKDGTVDGWGETQDRQRFRVRKYPGATRVVPDPAGRIFLVQKPGNEWSVMLNPASSEYYEEQRTGVIEGKLKGCTSVALSQMFVFAVKTTP